MPTGPHAAEILAGIAHIDDVLSVDLRRSGRDKTAIRMSESGDCARRIGYNLLGYAAEPHAERLLGIFAAGHFFEQLVLAGMRTAGLQVVSHTPDGQQFEAVGFDPPMIGHFDGRVLINDVISLVEIKSANTSRFSTMVAKGVGRSDPKYYAQMQSYMHHDSLEQAFYVAINKDNSDVYTEVVPYDSEFMDVLLIRLRLIWSITRQGLLPEPEFPKASYTCQSCPFTGHCPGTQSVGGNKITVG